MKNEVVSKLELKVLGGKGPDKTKYIVNVANQFFSDRKILLFSLETPKTLLKPNYNLQESDNIIVIDMLTKIEEIESYLAIEKPNYLLIDSIQLLKTDKEFLNVQDKIKYILDTLYNYIEEYNVNILVSDYLSEEETLDKYSSDTYSKCHQIWCIIDKVITRLK